MYKLWAAARFQLVSFTFKASIVVRGAQTGRWFIGDRVLKPLSACFADKRGYGRPKNLERPLLVATSKLEITVSTSQRHVLV
jgi:hypothetical protein